jgi:hypothetical protein
VNRQQAETGIYRLYLVAWAIFVFVVLVTFLLEADSANGERVAEVFLAVIGPWIGMKLGQWIYRGFVPKD